MLEIKNLSYKIIENEQEKVILDNISFSCDHNETIVITGENGSGKSTLLKIIMGILTPSSGQIFYNNVDITNYTIDEKAKLKFAYSFQTPVCFKGITVKKLLTLASENKKTVGDYCDILSKLGLCARKYLDREVNSKLSGGEQKRIDIASVLIRNANVNLFDEPEAGIDIWSFDSLVNLFKTNSANIIVSHQKKLIEKADKILLLSNGKIVKFDKTSKVLPLLNNTKSCKKLLEVEWNKLRLNFYKKLQT